MVSMTRFRHVTLALVAVASLAACTTTTAGAPSPGSSGPISMTLDRNADVQLAVGQQLLLPPGVTLYLAPCTHEQVVSWQQDGGHTVVTATTTGENNVTATANDRDFVNLDITVVGGTTSANDMVGPTHAPTQPAPSEVHPC